ncbi:hypothetical protein K1T71_011678 [Dendrolimus kikuchii]|uniref:Uncharacterized protein n=1 Tax=Dendrolimus kikuchii TaxID=765133 RepID=A0ACC1CM89_9NEOP|nr:hypothetical protein K1T71_011678 [Dendrolimus kikuchii]
MAPKGSMTCDLFVEFIQNQGRFKVLGKSLLIFDVAKCHLSIEALDEFDENDAVLYCLPSNTTHELQPLEKFINKSEENRKKALDAIKNGMAKKQAAKKYQVPRINLQFRIKKPDHKPQPGQSPVLNADKENKIKNWLNVSHAKGFPKRNDLLNSVSEFLKIAADLTRSETTFQEIQ